MKYLSLLFLLILISCNSNNDNITLYLCDIEQDIITVKQAPVEVLNKEPLGHPFSIKNIDNRYLVIKDVEAADKGLYIYDINNFNLIDRTGKLGEGPGEISYYLNPIAYKDGFLMKDGSKHLFYYFNIPQIKIESDYLPTEVTKYPNKKHFPFTLKMTNDSDYIGAVATITSQSTFEIEIAKGNIFNDSIEHLIDLPKNVDNHNLQYFFTASKNRIMMSYQHYNIFSVYNNHGEIIKGNLSKLVFLFDPICSVNLRNLTYNSVYF
ncbi:hypothetical protein K5X82_08045 [Halosquirtibacter xylanolyticus]|uniref:hypothetical protein n=1 Tax=Halosquirtibacter xylanolyticus TaxID=3374599 RepID=UPI0037480961|nr:hypothetical protein K5X82_08045 [Prolixibacteraceae bacterium]